MANVKGIRPQTWEKFLYARRLVLDDLEVQIACKRANISRAWYHKLCDKQKEGYNGPDTGTADKHG